jgi:hypothetical protein
MNNPHIIVGEPNRCVCGTYDGRPVSCADVMAAHNRIVDFCEGKSDAILRGSDLKLVRAVIIPLIKDMSPLQSTEASK